MFTPAIFTRNHNFWRDPFDEFNEMFPAIMFWSPSFRALPRKIST